MSVPLTVNILCHTTQHGAVLIIFPLNLHNNNRSFNMVKTHAKPYKHIIHTNKTSSLSRRTAITRPTHCHAGQQQYKV